jgi:P4 family phage/plasmid primase-like protien
VELEHLAKETIRALPDEAKSIESDAERAEFFKFCAISQRAVMVRNMVSLAQSDPRVVVPVGELDRHSYLLGVGNGAVDLRSGELLAPAHDHRITTITATEYDPEAQAPLFEQTVADVFFGDQDMIAFFQRLVGYSILAQPTEDVLVIPYGSGSNGKSTVLGAIREALGEHARMASSETFLSSGQGGGNAGAAREDVLRLRGARFVYVSEPDEGSELREGLIKSMTGGEPLPARGLYSKTTVEVVPTWVAFMPTNHRPIVKGDDHAIWRRLLPVPFTRNFDQDLTLQKDPERADKLAAEAKGILAWCVRGALAYQAQGLKAPGKVGTAKDDYKQDMDLLAEWLDECCELDRNYADTSARLWASWEAFAKARGELQFIRSARALGRRLSARFSARKGTGGAREMVGLRVRVVGDFE